MVDSKQSKLVKDN